MTGSLKFISYAKMVRATVQTTLLPTEKKNHRNRKKNKLQRATFITEFSAVSKN